VVDEDRILGRLRPSACRGWDEREGQGGSREAVVHCIIHRALVRMQRGCKLRRIQRAPSTKANNGNEVMSSGRPYHRFHHSAIWLPRDLSEDDRAVARLV
jgi:hypothetical protein